MFKLPYDEQTATDYFSELQWGIGAKVAFAIIPTAYFISKDQTLGQASALVIFVISICCAIAKGTEYRGVVKRFLALAINRGVLGKLTLLLKTCIFSVSLSIMFALAVGELNYEMIKDLIVWLQ